MVRVIGVDVHHFALYVNYMNNVVHELSVFFLDKNNNYVEKP